MPEPTPATMTEQLRQLHSGETTAVALMSHAIRRAEDASHLNAFLTLEPDMALERARSVDQARGRGAAVPTLAGLPVGVKDNIDIAGWITSGATPALAHLRAKQTGPVAQRLFDAGAIALGKTNLHELAFGVTNTNFAPIQMTRNPHDPSRITGGSSGGTAAAIAAGIVSAGLGTDTSGSIRIPAALCGIAGLRTSVGTNGVGRRYSPRGLLPISHTNDTAGPMAVSVADLALLDAVVTGEDPVTAAGLTGLRLGVPQCFWVDLDDEVARLCHAVCDRLTRAGAELVPVSLPSLRDAWRQVSAPVILHEPLEDIPAWLAAHGRGDITLSAIVDQIANPDVRAAFDVVMSESLAGSYGPAMALHRPELCRIYAAAFRDHGLAALIFPTVPVPAPPVHPADAFPRVSVNGRDHATFDTLIRNTDPGANAGLPGLSIPAGLTRDGLPVGIEIDGRVGSDRDLLSLGMTIERIVSEGRRMMI